MADAEVPRGGPGRNDGGPPVDPRGTVRRVHVELKAPAVGRILGPIGRRNRRIWIPERGTHVFWGELERIERDIFGSEPVS